MKQYRKQIQSILLIGILLLSTATNAFAADMALLQKTIAEVGTYVYETVENPQVASTGGEWAILGLSRSDLEIPQSYYDTYYENLESYVQENNGILHEKKYTEYSRVIVALSAIGKDATNVSGYNLLAPLGDFNKTTWQGINGAIWALIALDTLNYEIPQNTEAEIQATRALYVDEILSRQLDCGGWNLTDVGGSGEADADITGMVWQALGNYQDMEEVAIAIEKSIDCISNLQNADGGFSAWGVSASESVVQILIGLIALDLDIEDPRFVKNGTTLLDCLMEYHIDGAGFAHAMDGTTNNQMATEQGLYGLVAVERFLQNKAFLYDMTDVSVELELTESSTIEPETLDTTEQKTFADIQNNPYQEAIEALATRGIINGKGENTFDPEGNMTRAEFATLMVNALDLEPEITTKFTDVLETAWYAGAVGAANEYGIISGTTETTFAPNGNITKQEASSILTRVAKLYDLDATLDETEIRDTLAQFSDYMEVSNWAKESLAFCYKEGILEDSAITIASTKILQRDEIADMVYQLLLVLK
ncbi:S-layer homology domain-containing protein [Chakrabartyella piscis]|uniref:S-layer homology domain-containing protein n=1 Tax=Chakrabartyella piscis TaxID=2918914 RepID=UPI00295850B3|nr:S-layer homology domain-containing protein [Chakrabartyella piscis]